MCPEKSTKAIKVVSKDRKGMYSLDRPTSSTENSFNEPCTLLFNSDISNKLMLDAQRRGKCTLSCLATSLADDPETSIQVLEKSAQAESIKMI